VDRDLEERSFFTMPFVYSVETGWCGCELADPLAPEWEEDLNTWLRKELTKLCKAFEVAVPKPEWTEECLREERIKRHSRRQLWILLNTALIDNNAIEIFGQWPGEREDLPGDGR
jgi:hypothetical protein